MDIINYNSMAWDKAVDENDNWTAPVSKDSIARARAGYWAIALTPEKPVPRS
jgi:hypothetical protein